MKININKAFIAGLIILLAACNQLATQSQSSQNDRIRFVSIDKIRCGAERTERYFPLLAGKSIGVVCNQTSVIRNVHLIDSLVNAGFNLEIIFSPEHGFRGQAEAGAEIEGGKDTKTGIRIISLYGKNKKPAAVDLKGIDIIIFDIQDVGVRFYTYISTLALVMEAASEGSIPVIVLDRPDPNGFYIDGPVLDTAYRSFVGMHPVPVVYGMTIGEYAKMIKGEGWNNSSNCSLTVIPCEGYQHNMLVQLEIPPSPNLSSWQAIYLYPSLCLFEGTFICVGRGTDSPFQVIGHPSYLIGSFSFMPKAIPGVAENPPYKGQECYGAYLAGAAENYNRNPDHFILVWLMGMHDFFRDSTDFFTPYFDKLAGSDLLRNAILAGKTEPEIRKSWEPALNQFRQTRSKYLLYPE
jgi:uncharacterized protein YbbC (DUF1343 family)